jgi:hypothetical protein
MVDTTIFLGAGASKAEGYANCEPNEDSETPRLSKLWTFFSTF